jgi:GNAT superfamily N-acetyltransferase
MAVENAPNTAAADLTYRRATPDDLPACAAIWRTSINDYTARLNLPDIPEELGPILRLYSHLQSTDPERFVLAIRGDERGEERIVAFVSAVRRDALWFLSMLFVLPGEQAAGIGRTLLSQVMPADRDVALSTCTDSLQPISNGLYSSLGIPPRMPLFRLVGREERRDVLPPLPAGIRAIRMDEVAAGAVDRLGGAALDDELASLDRETAGFEHLEDHGFVRSEGRTGFLYLGPRGDAVGYGYTSESGRVGPIAVREADLLAPVVAHLVTAVSPRGAFGVWLPGAAGEAVTALLRAGFRFDGFPCLICWDRPVADYSRYVPISPGLL